MFTISVSDAATKEFYRDTVGTLKVKGSEISGYHKTIFPWLTAVQVAKLMGISITRATVFCENAVKKGFSQRYYEGDLVYYLFQ